jgi:cytochrome P450
VTYRSARLNLTRLRNRLDSGPLAVITTRRLDAHGVTKVSTGKRAPGPESRPWKDHSADFGRDPIGFLTRCARAYGDVVALRFGLERVLMLSHPEYIEQVMVTNSVNFTKAFKRNYQPILGNGLFMSEGDFWLRQRRILQPAFQRQRLALQEQTIVGIANRKLGTWRDGEARDFHWEMMQLLLEISAKTIFGVDDMDEIQELGTALAEVNRCIETDSGRPWYLPGWFPDARNRRLRQAARRLDECVFGLIRRRRNRQGDGTDILSVLTGEPREEGQRAMSDRQLRDELLNLLQAGRETTALALTWSWLLLAHHPAASIALQTELEHVLGETTATMADLPRLRFAESIVAESMRLFPPASILKRRAIRNCEIGGYSVRKGTSIMLPIVVVHRDPRFFNDPDKFRPERWTEELRHGLPRFAYFPFGGGPRQCIGTTLGMMTAVLVLSTIARRFEVQSAPGHAVTLWPTVTLRPRNGVHLIIKDRRRVTASVG